MAIYTIEADGKQFDIEGPDNATQEELQGAVDAHSGIKQAPQKDFLDKTLEAGQKGYDILNTPRKGIQMLTKVASDALPEGSESTSLTKNIATRLPRYATEVTGELAADLVHPINLLTAGAAKAAPLLAPVVKSTRLGRMLIAPTVENAGKAIGVAEKAAGIDVAEEAINSPRTRKAIITFANRLKNVVKQGSEGLANTVDAKTLNTLKTQTGDILDFLKVAREGASPKQLVSKGTIARLAQIKDALSGAVSKAEPAVGEALKDFAASKGRQRVVRALGGAAKTAAKVTGAGALGYGALKGLFQ